MEEFITKPRYQKTKKGATNVYLRLQDKLAVMGLCGDAALILYDFYMSKSSTPRYTFKDSTVAAALRWDLSKVKRNRLKLIKHDYFKQVNGKLADKRKVTITYLDPKAIKESNAVSEDELITKFSEEDEKHYYFEEN